MTIDSFHLDSIVLNNSFESRVLKDYLNSAGKGVEEFFEECMDGLQDGSYSVHGECSHCLGVGCVWWVGVIGGCVGGGDRWVGWRNEDGSCLSGHRIIRHQKVIGCLALCVDVLYVFVFAPLQYCLLLCVLCYC